MPSPLSDSTRLNRALIALWAIFWLLMIVVAVEDHRDEEGVRWWEPLVWEGSSCLVASVWLWLARRAEVRWSPLLGEPARWFGRHLAWLPVVGVTFVIAIYSIRHAFYAFTPEIYEHGPWVFLFFYEPVKVLLYASLWICIIFGLESFARWQSEREQLLTLQKHLAESQLAQLRAQLQPHFLFNALNTISSLMQVDVPRADRLLTQLADLLRASLHTGAQHMTSLRHELELLKLYAGIMQERFAGRVTLDWDIADDTLDASIPAMLLQPLLENAFRHGVERSTTPVAIRIVARRHGGRFEVTVRNVGTITASVGAGIGRTNCRERLALLYGAD
ncbi:MAG: histidine kinase, partial [Steroidobacteraceae bacterium]|nr:histidine kinase [Steroidobacteraceae bacterium]